MANIYSIYSVGGSIIQFLRNAYPQELREAHPCDFRVVSSGELADDTGDIDTQVLADLITRKNSLCHGCQQ